jgi:hypothetical protein
MIMAMQAFDFFRAMRMIVAGMIVIMASMIVIMAFVVMIVTVVAIVLMPIVIVVMVVPMIVVVMRMVMTGLALASRSLAGERSNRIAEAGHPLLDRFEIAAAIVAHRHRACCHRHGDVFDAGHASDGGIDFRCAGGAIHSANPVPCLCCFAHDFDPC